jgi:hypothetical protein
MRPPNFKKAAKKAVPVLSRVNTATLQPGRLLKLTDDANGWDFPNTDMSKFEVGQVYVEWLNKPSYLFLLLKIEEKHDERYHWYELTFLLNGDSPTEITFRSDGHFCTFCVKVC